jgi:hypothetical protein
VVANGGFHSTEIDNNNNNNDNENGNNINSNDDINLYLDTNTSFDILNNVKDETMIKTEIISDNVISIVKEEVDSINNEDPIINPINIQNGNSDNHIMTENISNNVSTDNMDITGETDNIVSTDTFVNANMDKVFSFPCQRVS